MAAYPVNLWCEYDFEVGEQIEFEGLEETDQSAAKHSGAQQSRAEPSKAQQSIAQQTFRRGDENEQDFDKETQIKWCNSNYVRSIQGARGHPSGKEILPSKRRKDSGFAKFQHSRVS